MSLKAQSAALETAYPIRILTLATASLRYLDSARGTETVLLLPGAVGTAESTRFLFAEIAKHYRVVTLTYPAVPTMLQLVQVIEHLLATLEVESVHLFGASYGGLVAQAFAKLRPGCVKTLVLSHTAPPAPSESGALRWSLPLLQALPFAVTRRLMLRRFTNLLRSLPDADFWSSFLAQEFSRIGKADLIAAFERVLNFNQITGAEISVPTLLIHSDADEMVKPHHQRVLRQCFPHAKEFTFTNAGHLVSITQREAYVQVICKFLASPRSAASVR